MKELAALKLTRLQLYYNLARHFRQTQLPADPNAIRADSNIRYGHVIDPETPPPSLDRHIEPFLRKLWDLNFTSANPTSPRILEVKFGEWEVLVSRQRPAVGGRQSGMKGRTRWIVKPHENAASSDLIIKMEGDSAEDDSLQSPLFAS